MKYVDADEIVSIYEKIVGTNNATLLKSVVEQAPKITIVRCSECEHYNDHSIRIVNGDNRGVCRVSDRIVNANNFCSWGEEKDNE